MLAAFPLLVELLSSLIGSVLKQQRESWLVESKGRPHVVLGVFDLQLQLSDPGLHNRNNQGQCNPSKYQLWLNSKTTLLFDYKGCILKCSGFDSIDVGCLVCSNTNVFVIKFFSQASYLILLSVKCLQELK